MNLTVVVSMALVIAPPITLAMIVPSANAPIHVLAMANATLRLTRATVILAGRVLTAVGNHAVES